MTRPLSVDDVQRLLVDRIRGGEFGVGSRLPSVRALADAFGSNPSTVDRALHRLAEMGMVRTVPRQGTYVSKLDVPATTGNGTEALEKALVGLRASGMSIADVRRLIDKAVQEVFRDPRIVFLECNLVDLNLMAETVSNATGVALVPLLLDDASPEVVAEFDVVAVPLFHVSDLGGIVEDFSKVVELNFHPSAKALRALATLDPSTRVVVSAPTERGIERMASLTRQYFRGDPATHHSLADPIDILFDHDVVVHTHAAQLDPEVIAQLPLSILIEWELDPSSSATFRTRIEAATSG
jgi:DNA-binding transcriptional regulator YhcF (GntR family)